MNFDSTPEIIVAAVIGLLSLQAIRKFCGYPVKGNIAQMIVSFYLVIIVVVLRSGMVEAEDRRYHRL